MKGGENMAQERPTDWRPTSYREAVIASQGFQEATAREIRNAGEKGPKPLLPYRPNVEQPK